MRKLNILKAIVDYLWFISIFCYPILILFSVLVVLDYDFDIPIKLYNKTIALNNMVNKFVFLIIVLSYGIILFAIFKFRKLLQLFKNKIIFEHSTALLLNEIGRLLIIFSSIDLITEYAIKISNKEIEINFGYGSFLGLLSLGLFFVVLAEVFKIGKNLKEENELTV